MCFVAGRFCVELIVECLFQNIEVEDSIIRVFSPSNTAGLLLVLELADTVDATPILKPEKYDSV